MIELPAKFAEENNKGKNKPALIVELQSDILFNEQHLQSDWTANESAANVDLTTVPGAIILDRESGTIEQLTGNYGGYFPPWIDWWQSFVMSENNWIDNVNLFIQSGGNIPINVSMYSQDKTVLIWSRFCDRSAIE